MLFKLEVKVVVSLLGSLLCLFSFAVFGQDVSKPVVIKIDPPEGAVTNLPKVSITFNRPVANVDAGDLRVNQVAATNVIFSGDTSTTTYTFFLPEQDYGPLDVFWAQDCGIQDLFTPPNFFDPVGGWTVYHYELINPGNPKVLDFFPKANVTLKVLTEVSVTFNKAVTGVVPSDLLVNGKPGKSVTGGGAGPYIFTFDQPPNGPVEFSWAAQNSIQDYFDDTTSFTSTPWSCTVNSNLVRPPLQITEINAANTTGLKDEDNFFEDWIEIYNPTDALVSLAGWSLTDDPELPGQWIFPNLSIPAKSYVVVFASGKDRRVLISGRKLHTNFTLKYGGEYLGLFTPDSPRQVSSDIAPEFPEQRNDYSYGLDPAGKWKYYKTPTPGLANPASLIEGITEPVHFSVNRGFFNAPFQVSLYSPTPGATIKYTMDGRDPTDTIGTNYTGLLTINKTTILRAVALAPNKIPSRTVTHTYLYNIASNRKLIPALSLVTSPTNLYGATGIMEFNPRNTTQHGIAWERPVSVELIRPEDNGGFQIGAGIRVQGGGYIRERLNYTSTTPPTGKYSFRLYFRSDYGDGSLKYPLFADCPLQTFDRVVLRAGMNDPENPFIRDEFARRLFAETGQVSAHGMFVNLFLNGVYKGYYNPTERVDGRFFQAWHGGGDKWDEIASFGELREGDLSAWNALKTLVSTKSPAIATNYQAVADRLDLTNFVDYLIPLLYGHTGDWPANNWRVAREHTTTGKFRYYIWDAEWSFGYNGDYTSNPFADQLANNTTADIQIFYTRLRLSPEFKLLFADRVHKHFFNGGALTDERIAAIYEKLRLEVNGTIPSFNNSIATSWIPNRHRYITNHFNTAGLLASSNAPTFAPFGGKVPIGYKLSMGAKVGKIYFTTNGIDPRVPFTSAVNSNATEYVPTAPLVINNSLLIKARTLNGTNWSALSEASFQVAQPGIPLRITEIMYNPPGGDAYEFLEIQNAGMLPLDISRYSLDGVGFRFPVPFIIAAGERIILASDANPALFAQRYPGVKVAGYFSGALSNGGERVALKDPLNNIVDFVDYDDEKIWPREADGFGYSLELADSDLRSDSISSWRISSRINGSPDAANASLSTSGLILNELQPPFNSQAGWLELYNNSELELDLTNYSLTDGANKFTLLQGTKIPPNGYVVVYFDGTGQGLHAGFQIAASNSTIVLQNPLGARIDSISYGTGIPPQSVGKMAPEMPWTLTDPTPGSANGIAATSSSTNLIINEFVANSAVGASDWIELYNSDPTLPLALGDLFLSNSNTVARLPELSWLRSNSFLVLYADEQPGADHLPFKLNAAGGKLGVLDMSANQLNSLVYPKQTEALSSGRYPDGATNVIPFYGSPTPGRANYLLNYTGPLFSEMLVTNKTLLEGRPQPAGWIELYNPSSVLFDLSGMSITLDPQTPGQFIFAAGSSMPGFGYLRIWCDSTQPASSGGANGYNLGYSLPAESGAIYLLNSQGYLVDQVQYGQQLPDVTVAKAGALWSIESAPTPGLANSLPAPMDLTAIKFNEWLGSSTSGPDWIEIYNASSSPVNVGGFVITDDPSIAGRTNSTIRQLSLIPPNGFMLFTCGGEPGQIQPEVRFSIDAFGETLRLYNSTFTIVDEVNLTFQEPGVSEGRQPDGSDSIRRFKYLATPGYSNGALAADADADGIPDQWERDNGLDPSNNLDGDADLDGDGFSNLQEFVAGTNPRDPVSNLALHARSAANGNTVLEFQAQAGKSYSVFYSSEIGSRDWRKLQDILPSDTPQSVSIGAPNLNASATFYIVVTPARQ